MADEGAVTVCVRVRPLIARENASGDKVTLHWRSENDTVSDVNGTKIFSYDHVFHSSDNTQQLYDGVAVPIIQSAVRGYNGTIFAYGQTASGKTYTMMGNEDSMGIIPKAIQHVFKIICEIPDREFLLRVSYMEIYNETITDLLCDNRKKKPLGIREDVNRNTYVEDLIEEVVVSPAQVMEWIRKGERNRHYGETKMNEHSSRSHTIFRMIIESRERSDPANANCDGAVMVSHLNLVDLAGSERASQTGSEGVRLKEGCNINRSLFILSQVIKKLCDDPSGFINYRDSKLTRILQNSLGGNAKTVIICTITPVSFDETLSTLQFANTAKGMKNTPKVNEVLDDDALLKRYRKEILDLKKQLEEVSSKTQIHAMEKDQLAQLLEEKNSLQKVQEDRIRNLTEMLVTSASFSSKQNAKGKRRRRVTWAPGKINQASMSFFEDFENAMPTETKKMKLSLPAVPDVEDSTLENSEYESTCLLPPDQISEVEWIAGPNMNWTQKDFEESVQLCEALALEKDIAVNEVNVLQANFDNLVVENEQLKSEINEMKEKLKEKTEIDEFEALEKQTQKDHEIQLMHEIANLKNLVSNAEVYNEELEAEINSKLEQLKEKENKIKILQNRVEELQKAGVGKKETSFSMGDSDKLIEEIQQLNKSLLDSEAIALDAKKESAFLRSENLELKEKMNDILNNHSQMEKDVQLYQSQIEAGKASYRKMQTDLQRELQSLFQENARLTSLMEGKVPKDLLSHVELEKKAADLKGELENALKENAFLQKRVNELSEFQSLPNTVEMQKKEILEKCEELRLLKLENAKLLSEVADNEMRLKHMSEEIEKSKDSLTDAQLKYLKSDEEYVALKQLHEEIEQKYIAASETNEQMKLQIEYLSKEAQESKIILDEVKVELSIKMKELEEKTAEQKQLLELREDLIQTQQKLNEMEQLKEEERISEVRREAEDLEIQAVLQQLTECQEEIKTLNQERDDLKQKGESLQAEIEQLREDMKDTVSMNILAQEDLRNTQNSLKESQNTVKKLEKSISEKESQILSVEEALGKTIKELQIQISEMTEEMKIITSERDQLAEEKSESNSCRESDQLQVQKEQILFLTQENRSLREKMDSLLLKTEELGEGTLIPQIQGQSMEQELFLLREELSQAQRKLHEMEEAKASEYQGESEKMERTDVIPKAPKSQEVSIQTKSDDDDFKMQLVNLQNERDQLRETLQQTMSKNSEMQEELRCTRESLGQHQEMIVELQGSISEKENQLSKVQEALKERTDELQQKLTEVTENLTRVSAEYGNLLAEKEQTERTVNEQVCQQLERITLLNKEKDELQQMVETCKEREEHLLKLQRQSEILKDSLTSKISEMTEEMKIITSERDQLAEEKSESNSCRESDQLQVQKEQILFLTQENRSLQEKLDSLLLKTEELGEGTLIPQIQGQSMEQELFLLREELSQAQRKLHEMEEAKASEYQGESEKMERTDVIPKAPKSQEVSIQTKSDDDDFKMQLVNLQNERDQLRETLQQTMSKNSEMQEELRCTRESLGQHQEMIVELQGSISEKENQLSKVQEALKERTDELQQKLTEVTENLTRVSAEYGNLLAEKEQTERTVNEQVCQQLERITLLNKEKDELQQMVETCKEREEHLLKLQRQSEILKDSLTSKISEMTEEMKIITSERDQLAEEKSESNSCRESDQLQVQKEQILFLTQENRSLQEKLDSLLLKTEELGEGTLIPQIQGQSMEQELFLLREELSQAQRKLHEMEEAKASEYQGESEKMERTDVIPKAPKSQEVSIQTKSDDDDFKMQLVNLQNERDQLRETLQQTMSKNSEMQEELRCTRESLGQHQEMIVELQGSISEKENQLSKVQESLKERTDELQQKLTEVTENLTRVSAEYGNLLAEKEQTERTVNEQVCQQLERITLLNKEKDELQQMVETCKEREEHLLKLQRQSEILKDSLTSKISEMTEEMKIITSERDQLAEEKSESNSCRESDQLQVQKEQILFLTQENRSLQEKLDSLLLKTEELGEGTLIPQIQGQSMEQELFLLREELSQAQRKLHEMEEAKASEYQGESEKMERTDVIPKAPKSQEVSIQTKSDDDDFKMQLVNLQNERDQLRETLQQTMSKNSEMQEELRCTRESLGQHQEMIVELQGSISEKENQLSKVQEALKERTDELQQKLTEVTENLTRVSAEYGNLLAEKEQTERTVNEQVCQQLERITLLNKEKDELQQMVETCKEREEHLLKLQRQSEILKDSLTSKISEMTEEMKIITSERDQLAEEKSESNSCRESDQLQVQKEQILFLTQENRSLQEKLDSLLLKTEELGEGTLIPQIQGQSMEQELFLLREELSQAQRKLHEMEEAKASEYQEESEKMERTDVIPKAPKSQEVSIQTKSDDDDFKMQLVNLQNERDQLRETLQETMSKNSEMQEELRCTRESLGQHQEMIVELQGSISEKENQLSKVQEALKERTDELQQKLTEVTENLTRVSAEYGNLLAEKEQTERTVNEQVCQQLERITLLNKEKDELQQMVETCKEREGHLLKLQRQSEILKDSLTSKIQQLTETLNTVSCEKDQLLAERTSHSLQFKEHISSVNREKEELQKLLQNVKSERDQLKTELQRNSDMCLESKAKLDYALEQLKHKNLNNMSIQVKPVDIAEQVADESLKEKTLKIKELLEKFPTMGKRYECLSTTSLKLKSELNSQKALIAVILPQLTLEQRKQVKTLQTKNEEMNTRLQKLLTKLKLLFSSVCNKKREYHTAIHKYEMDLLDEKRKQDHLQSQIQCLRKINLKQNEVPSQELNSSEGLQSFHLDAESILKDVSETEQELVCIEAELQQEETARKETIQFWEACSGTHWDAEELKEELEKDNERLLQVFKFWTPKVKILLELSSELDARTANYSKNADVELKQRKEKNQELLQDLNTLKEKLAPGGSASLALEEENYRLHNKLKAAEQDKKAMEVKIQKLENVINEVGESVKEKDDRISKLQAQIRIKTETSELTQLHAKLNEMDNCLRTALTEKQSLQAKLDKGAELYKEEIDLLKTQLVKCDLERMKQSNSFEMKLANYKAVAEHQEQQLTKLKEELRRAHQEQDVTVLKEADPQQSQIPLTCGGGSGIVQSTQMLVIKSEQAKLQKENLQLKKQKDLLLSNELQLKEELRKWKERALKLREQSSRETIRETIPRSPKKAVSYFFKEQMPSPSKETASQEIVTQDLPKPLPLTCPTNFFDNSNLGVLTDTRPEGTEATEERLKHLFGTSDKDKAPDCSTQ